MSGNGRRTADSALLIALASGQKVEDAAQTAGVGPTTVYRRLQEPDFRQQLAELRAQMQERAVGVLADASAEAALTLKNLANNAKSETVRLGASRAVLELGMRLREQLELEERITAIEQRIGARAA